MKDFIHVKDLVHHVESKQKGLMSWIDKLTFFRIFLVWVCMVIGFGLIYYFFSNGTSFFVNSVDQTRVQKITDLIYFSFVTATTTGFGDIIPIGVFKLVSILEVIFGLLMLALVTSKLVSIKQNMILSELYELSFNEKINRLRSSLLLFRQNISRIITKVEDNTIKKREVAEIYMYISSFDDVLNEMILFFGKGGEFSFTKDIDSVNAELIIMSILNSFEKINELIASFNEKNIDWKRDITISLMDRTIHSSESIFERFVALNKLSAKSISELSERKKKVLSLLRNNISAAIVPQIQ